MPQVTITSPLPAGLTEDNFALLCREVYRDSGIVLDDSKLYLIQSRLAPVMKFARLDSLDALCSALQNPKCKHVRKRVVEAMTTNETLFFRDPLAFDALQKVVLPELIARNRHKRRLSIWSAAASSGQEAYSVAILLTEMNLPAWNVRVLGTDLNGQVLDRARAGRFLPIEISRGLPPHHVGKYFQQSGSAWQVGDVIRSMVCFEQFDLRDNPLRFGSFDLVLCRNVLIYFDTETKRKVLNGIASVLTGGGYLLLGCAESTLNLSSQFEQKIIERASFYRLA